MPYSNKIPIISFLSQLTLSYVCLNGYTQGFENLIQELQMSFLIKYRPLTQNKSEDK